MAAPIRYDIVLVVRVTRDVCDAINRAAASQGLKQAQWVREAIASVLTVEGALPYTPGGEAA